MIGEYSILAAIAERPWLVVGLALIVLGILLIPYDIVNNSRGRIRRHQIRALLWAWESQPSYTRLYLPGLLLLQRALLRGLRAVSDLICERILAGIANILRRWIG